MGVVSMNCLRVLDKLVADVSNSSRTEITKPVERLEALRRSVAEIVKRFSIEPDRDLNSSSSPTEAPESSSHRWPCELLGNSPVLRKLPMQES